MISRHCSSQLFARTFPICKICPMNFELNQEQAMLRDSVDRFGAENYPAGDRNRMLRQDEVASARRWRAMAELGWLGLLIPEEQGGLGGTAIDAMAVMEAFGRHLILEPYVTTCILAPALLAPQGEAGADLLSSLARGDIKLALAHTEPCSGFDLGKVAARAEPVDGGFSVTGTKSHVEDGADADWFIVTARASGGDMVMALVQKDAPGLEIERFRGIDHHRHAHLALRSVRVDRDAVTNPAGGTLPLLEEAVDRAIAAHLAEAVGSMEALRGITLDHLRTRRQFGVPIGSFQVLQHRMVDIEIACEEARSMLYHATLHLDRDATTRRRAISAAKVRVGQCALFVGRQAVQLHGGLGMSAELIVSHHLKRLMMIDVAYGNAEHHKGLFADAA